MKSFLPFLLTGFLIGVGCTQSEFVEEESSSSTAADGPIAGPTDAAIGTVEFSENVESGRFFFWQVKDADGNILPCSDPTLPKLTCDITTPGIYSIDLEVIDYNGDVTNYQLEFNLFDPNPNANQAPLIGLDISDSSGGIVASIRTQRQLEAGNTVFPQGNYTFDFSQTTDDQDCISKYEVDIADGNGYREVGKTSTQNFPTVSVKLVSLRVTDCGNPETGEPPKARVKTFLAYVTCPDSQNNLSIAADALTATVQGTSNHIQYCIKNGAVTGGSGNYFYSLDANGDDRLDTKEFSSQCFLSRSLYAGIRDVGLKVRDKTCNFIEYSRNPIDLQVPRIDDVDSTPVSAIKDALGGDIYFLQTDVSPGQGMENDPAADSDFIALRTTPPKGEKYNLEGSISKPSANSCLVLRGLYEYEEKNDGTDTNHGSSIKICGLNYDNPAATNATVADMTYTVEEVGDSGFTQKTFTKNGSCSAQAEVDMKVTQKPCSDGTNVNSYEMEVWGKAGACLLASGGDRLQTEKTAYYFKYQRSDRCVGGGGGGSGGSPPPAL
jgi:hypothetical protein